MIVVIASFIASVQLLWHMSFGVKHTTNFMFWNVLQLTLHFTLKVYRKNVFMAQSTWLSYFFLWFLFVSGCPNKVLLILFYTSLSTFQIVKIIWLECYLSKHTLIFAIERNDVFMISNTWIFTPSLYLEWHWCVDWVAVTKTTSYSDGYESNIIRILLRVSSSKVSVGNWKFSFSDRNTTRLQ